MCALACHWLWTMVFPWGACLSQSRVCSPSGASDRPSCHFVTLDGYLFFSTWFVSLPRFWDYKDLSKATGCNHISQCEFWSFRGFYCRHAIKWYSVWVRTLHRHVSIYCCVVLWLLNTSIYSHYYSIIINRYLLSGQELRRPRWRTLGPTVLWPETFLSTP